MLNKQVEEYLIGNLKENDEWVSELEHHALIDHVPIMDPLGMDFLMQLVRMTQPKNILEIGTAIGYSALRMLEAYPETKIITIERDDKRYNEAIKYFEKYDEQKSIDILFGDAISIIPQLSEQNKKFDLIFIDAAKGKYKEFFSLASPMLSKDGIVVSDNVLFRGYVANDQNTNNRYKKIVEKIQQYNDWLMNQPDYTTTITPIGDGIAISVKDY